MRKTALDIMSKKTWCPLQSKFFSSTINNEEWLAQHKQFPSLFFLHSTSAEAYCCCIQMPTCMSNTTVSNFVTNIHQSPEILPSIFATVYKHTSKIITYAANNSINFSHCFENTCCLNVRQMIHQRHTLVLAQNQKKLLLQLLWHTCFVSQETAFYSYYNYSYIISL